MSDQQQTGQDAAAQAREEEEKATPVGETPGAAVVPAAEAADAQAALRVSHEDRDQVAEALRVAAGDGRLDSDELDERLEKALTARTYADLVPLLSDLPAAGTSLAPLPGPLAAVLAGGVPSAPARELMKIHVTSGHSKREGQWVVPARMDLKSRSGHIALDFTKAVISQPTLHIDAEVRSGHILLVTRPGIAVDVDDVSVRSGEVKVAAPGYDSVPVFFRITISGSCRSGVIMARPAKPPRGPRRTLWQWLRGAPRRKAISA